MGMHNPSPVARFFLRIVLNHKHPDEILGDYEEIYRALAEEKKETKARIWLWTQVFLAVPPFIKSATYWGVAMFQNNLKISLRILKRHKAFSVINVFGLAIGLACCISIGLYIQDELSYDGFHDKSDRIFRLVSDLKPPGDARAARLSTNGWPVGRATEEQYPGIEALTYIRTWPSYPILHKQRIHYPTMFYADSAFFRIFSFPLISGDPATALSGPFSIVLSQELALRLFGDEDAIGKTLILRDDQPCTVTGVVQVPENSHIQFEALLSFESLASLTPQVYEDSFANGWYNMNVHNYVLLRPGVSSEDMESKIKNLVSERIGDYQGYSTLLRLEPVGDIYLRSDRGNGLGPSSDIGYIYLLTGISLVILIIACINFMNLATARSTERAKEVGMRKVVGSRWGSLVRQFLSESILITSTALASGVLLLALLLPFFNNLVDKNFSRADLLQPLLLLTLLGLALAVGILSGFYPAVALSSFKPIEVLKGNFSTGLRGRRLRQGLVVFQFIISCILIISTLVVMNQLRFMLNADLGFDKEQVVVLDARRADSSVRSEQFEAIKQELASHVSVRQVTATLAVPGGNGWRGQFAYPEGRAQDDGMELEYIAVDHDYVKTMGLNIVAGRDFSREFPTDTESGILLNESAVSAIGWGSPEEAVGKHIASPGSGKKDGIVVGVVEDYHHHGLQEPIGPIMLGINPGIYSLFAVRVGTSELQGALEHLETVWQRFFPGYDFAYFFLDEYFGRQYQTERKLTRIFGTFASLAILIACMGLFGLTTFTVERRTKEIGVRKVLGASEMGIVVLLARDISRLLLFSFVIAMPIGYLIMSRWLQGFSFHANVHLGILLVSGLIVLLIAWLTIAYQSLRAALSNPSSSLRYE